MRSWNESAPLLDTDAFSSALRSKAIDLPNRRVLVTRYSGSQQATDLTDPVNCDGCGRVRHFRRKGGPEWIENPLPIDPACRALGVQPSGELLVQVFQNAVCNWRCWYCYVDFKLLSAMPAHSAWKSANDLLEGYLAVPTRPLVIDVSGGQPDLTPEWIVWMMDALESRGLSSSVYLWSDDNLSNDYHWRFLSESQRNRISGYRMYGRVCCFKGYNSQSFSFNTMAHASLFGRQFDLMQRLIDDGLDVYGYVTFTTPSIDKLSGDMSRFVDRLQSIDPHLPLRTIPLEIEAYSPVLGRMDGARTQSLNLQYRVLERWVMELDSRYSVELRQTPICDVRLGK